MHKSQKKQKAAKLDNLHCYIFELSDTQFRVIILKIFK